MTNQQKLEAVGKQMKTIPKSECLALIERLADKTLSFGCRIKHKDFTDCYHECYVPSGIIVRTENTGNEWNYYYTEQGDRVHDEEISCCGKILGHPVMLGDVLARIDLIDVEELGGTDWIPQLNLMGCWRPCGLKKSLNEILEGAEECWLCDECGELILSEDGGCENEPRCYGNDNAYIEAITGKEAELFLFINEVL